MLGNHSYREIFQGAAWPHCMRAARNSNLFPWTSKQPKVLQGPLEGYGLHAWSSRGSRIVDLVATFDYVGYLLRATISLMQGFVTIARIHMALSGQGYLRLACAGALFVGTWKPCENLGTRRESICLRFSGRSFALSLSLPARIESRSLKLVLYLKAMNY